MFDLQSMNIASHYKTSKPSHTLILESLTSKPSHALILESLSGTSIQLFYWKDPEQSDKLNPITSLPEGSFPEIFLMQRQNSYSFIFFWVMSTAPLWNVNVPGFNDVTR